MKDLPFFKFSPSQWLTGDITLCSMEAQGIFINLCSYYWIRGGGISLAFAKQKFSNAKAIDELLHSNIIAIDDNEKIVISFLDEQLNEFSSISMKRSQAGRKGGVAKAKQMPSKCQANANTVDKSRVDKSRVDKSNIPKKNYSEFVRMKKSEYENLVQKHGEHATKKMIEILDNYKGSTGKRYKDDYRAILSWVVNRYNDDQKKLNGNHNPKTAIEKTLEARRKIDEDFLNY